MNNGFIIHSAIDVQDRIRSADGRSGSWISSLRVSRITDPIEGLSDNNIIVDVQTIRDAGRDVMEENSLAEMVNQTAGPFIDSLREAYERLRTTSDHETGPSRPRRRRRRHFVADMQHSVNPDVSGSARLFGFSPEG